MEEKICSPVDFGRLGRLNRPPEQLFYRGVDLESLDFSASVAVVGSREVSDDGLETAHSFGRHIAESGKILISGLALGIDTAAMEGCIEAGGVCVGVLPAGVVGIVPRQNISLAMKILETKGSLISEHSGEMKLQKWMFLERNRIIAALSSEVVIGEARDGGWAWNTIATAWSLEIPTFKLSNSSELIPIFQPQKRLI